ncbi:MAG: PIG-L family deacetylase, partial [Thermoanaerobaculia bacterium]
VHIALVLLVLPGLILSCRTAPGAAGAAAAPVAAGAIQATAGDSEALTRYPALLVIAPHPDDESLGFAGLVDAYRSAGKPVRVIVVTDGDAYCEACRFWKSSSVNGPTCDAADLSNFATPEVDSFAEVRRAESAKAAGILGLPPPLFLGYPDTGLGAAWTNFQEGDVSKPLRRSDFSHCESCESCAGGYGEGPETELSAETLLRSLREEIASMPDGALIATTHRLDGHPDHAALGSFVAMLDQEPGARFAPHPVAYAVIHAHTAGPSAQPDCWYPAPTAPVCPCMDQARALADPKWIDRLAAQRFLPDSPAALPDDAPYGEAKQLRLPERMYRGADAIKLKAVASYASQLGRRAREGDHPAALNGILDCSGYLMAFVRSTEAFVLIEPGAASKPEAGHAATPAGGSDAE